MGMTDTLRLWALLAEATPGPWIRPWGTSKIHQAFGHGCDDIGLPDRDIDLACAAVNALPDLLERLAALEGAARRYQSAEWALRLEADRGEPVAAPEHNARVEEWRTADRELRAALKGATS